jgi:hypothetical protein
MSNRVFSLFTFWFAAGAGLFPVIGCGSADKPTVEQFSQDVIVGRTDTGNHRSSDTGTRVDDSGEQPRQDLVVPDTSGLDPDGVEQPDVSSVPDYLPEDVGCVPGTKCYEDEYKIMGSMVTIIVDAQAFNPEWYFLDVLPPQTKSVSITIKSNGFNQLTLVDAFLETASNPSISLQWTTPGMPGGLPLTLFPPGKGEPTQVEGILTYAPNQTTPATPAVLTVWSSDPDHLSRSVVFKPKEQGADIELPISAVNYGCGNYCFGQQFVIENAGNQALVIQSTSFANPSAEWTVQAPTPGTSLPPKGSPGYAPINLTIDYCDSDSYYVNDSNEFNIFSNDPDENPATIYLNVMLPDQCPNR